jgi:recombination protein RecA
MSKANGNGNGAVVDLASALARIERQFGEGSVISVRENRLPEVEAISTGALSLDLALGVGGVPRGRVVEVYGPESSGKTTLAYHVIAEAQRAGGRSAFIDAEHAMDPAYAAAIGVDMDALLLSQPDWGEQALEIADLLARSGEVALVVVDSVAALVPKAELEGQMGDQTVGLQARMMSQALRKLAGNLRQSKATCLFTNQLRERIGVIYGPKETQPGGRALKFYASQRLDIRRVETLKDGDDAVGNRVRVKVAKNKVAAPFGVAEFDIDFGRGISQVGCVLDLGVEHRVIERRGAFFTYGKERLGQGRSKAKATLEGRPELVEAIAREVRERVEGSGGGAVNSEAKASGEPSATRAEEESGRQSAEPSGVEAASESDERSLVSV